MDSSLAVTDENDRATGGDQDDAPSTPRRGNRRRCCRCGSSRRVVGEKDAQPATGAGETMLEMTSDSNVSNGGRIIVLLSASDIVVERVIDDDR